MNEKLLKIAVMTIGIILVAKGASMIIAGTVKTVNYVKEEIDNHNFIKSLDEEEA